MFLSDVLTYKLHRCWMHVGDLDNELVKHFHTKPVVERVHCSTHRRCNVLIGLWTTRHSLCHPDMPLSKSSLCALAVHHHMELQAHVRAIHLWEDNESLNEKKLTQLSACLRLKLVCFSAVDTQRLHSSFVYFFRGSDPPRLFDMQNLYLVLKRYLHHTFMQTHLNYRGEHPAVGNRVIEGDREQPAADHKRRAHSPPYTPHFIRIHAGRVERRRRRRFHSLCDPMRNALRELIPQIARSHALALALARSPDQVKSSIRLKHDAHCRPHVRR